MEREIRQTKYYDEDDTYVHGYEFINHKQQYSTSNYQYRVNCIDYISTGLSITQHETYSYVFVSHEDLSMFGNQINKFYVGFDRVGGIGILGIKYNL